MSNMTAANVSSDAGKYIAAKLIALSDKKLVLEKQCDPADLPQGFGKVASFTKTTRLDVPAEQLTEGTTPSESSFTVSAVTVTCEQWGLFVSLTDVAAITTKHPMLNQALNAVADVLARLKDRNIGEVLQDSTNKQYWDGTRANRVAITAGDVFKSAVFNKARSDLGVKGCPGKVGRFFVCVMDPQVEADILGESTAVGGFVAAAQYSNIEALQNAETGRWLGMLCITSNNLPVYTKAALITPSYTTGGALSGTIYFKTTRVTNANGYEECIEAEGNHAMSTDTRASFTAPATAGYTYNIYAGSVTGDANLFLAKQGLAPSGVYLLDALPTSGQTPPETPNTAISVHTILCFASEAVNNVALAGATLQPSLTPAGASDSDPLQQRRKVGCKIMAKAGIRDADRFKVIELASAF